MYTRRTGTGRNCFDFNWACSSLTNSAWAVSVAACFLRHSVYPCRPCSLIGEDSFYGVSYPFFPTDESIEMVELMVWVMLCLDGETMLGFDNIGHTF